MQKLTISQEKQTEVLSKFGLNLSCYRLDKEQRIHVMLVFEELCLQIISNTQNCPISIEYDISSTYGQVEIVFNIPKEANIGSMLKSSNSNAENLEYYFWNNLLANLENTPDISEKNNYYSIKLKLKLQKKFFLSNLKFAFNNAKKTKRYLVLALFISIFSLLLNIVAPILSGYLIAYFSESAFGQALQITIALIASYILCALLETIAVKLFVRIKYDVTYNVAISIISEITNYNEIYISSQDKGSFSQMFSGDLKNISIGLEKFTVNLYKLLIPLGTLIAVAIIDPLCFAVAFFGVAISWFVSIYGMKKYYVTGRLYLKQKDNYVDKTIELVQGFTEIKLLNSAPKMINSISKSLTEANKTGLQSENIFLNYRLIASIASYVFGFLYICLLIAKCSSGVLSVSLAIVLFNYYTKLSSSFGDSVVTILSFYKDFNLSAERLRNLFETEDFYLERKDGKTRSNIKGEIILKDINFAYNHHLIGSPDINVLKNISLTIKPGTTVAFVGPSGCGKSTILKLISNIYDVYNGSILLDGVPYSELSKSTISDSVSYIQQDPYIFNLSVKENLLLAKPDATAKQILDACKQACIYDDITKLRNGFDTVMKDNASMMSGGQKQRLSIARAILKDSPIILLDEATSALDNITQSKIVESLEKNKNKKTIIIVAHRMSTIINSDKIYVMKNNEIVMSGTHEELLNNSKYYKELYDHESSKKDK